MPIFTIGHSTRSAEELLTLLRSNGVRTLADVRTVPRSRRNPQFAREALGRSLETAAIRYVHLPKLGGLRRPRPDSPNTGWHNEAFRGYADHMASEAFAGGLAAVVQLAADDGPLAVMCAEAVPWRCHRSLLADALLAQGIAVEHIIGPGPRQLHHLTPFARLEGAAVSYPAPLL